MNEGYLLHSKVAQISLDTNYYKGGNKCPPFFSNLGTVFHISIKVPVLPW